MSPGSCRTRCKGPLRLQHPCYSRISAQEQKAYPSLGHYWLKEVRPGGMISNGLFLIDWVSSIHVSPKGDNQYGRDILTLHRLPTSIINRVRGASIPTEKPSLLFPTKLISSSAVNSARLSVIKPSISSVSAKFPWRTEPPVGEPPNAPICRTRKESRIVGKNPEVVRLWRYWDVKGVEVTESFSNLKSEGTSVAKLERSLMLMLSVGWCILVKETSSLVSREHWAARGAMDLSVILVCRNFRDFRRWGNNVEPSGNLWPLPIWKTIDDKLLSLCHNEPSKASRTEEEWYPRTICEIPASLRTSRLGNRAVSLAMASGVAAVKPKFICFSAGQCFVTASKVAAPTFEHPLRKLSHPDWNSSEHFELTEVWELLGQKSRQFWII